MTRVLIQFQDVTGDWRTISECENQNQVIKMRLDSYAASMRKRVRAVDRNTGSIIDLR